jgi:hypothetical protein
MATITHGIPIVTTFQPGPPGADTMDRGTLDFHRSMHDLVRADYLEEPASPALTAQGMYLITFKGIAVADNY